MDKNHMQHMSIATACHRAIKDKKGGVAAFAATYGYNAHTLQNKLNPTQDTHVLTVPELECIIEYTRDERILDAIAETHGSLMWFDMGLVGGLPSDVAMLETVTKLFQRVGMLAGKVQKSLEDGKVDADELRDLQAEFFRVVRAGAGVIERAKQLQPNN